ncbi:hypothetical protein D3C87_1249550 [compost metagenome]
MRSSSADREGATRVQKATWVLLPGRTWTRWRRAKMGSSTVPVVLERGTWRCKAWAVARVRPWPMKRARSDSYCRVPARWSSTMMKWAAHTSSSSGDLGRRVAIRAPSSARYSVTTKSLLKAGWARSASGVVSTSSA